MKKYLLPVILFYTTMVQAQVNKYNTAFRQMNSGYTVLSGGTVWQSGTAISTDGNSGAITLPVAFRYNNKVFTQLYINNNGFVMFNINGSIAVNYTPISKSPSTYGNYEGAVAGMAANLVASTVSGAAPEISYGTVGTVFVVQFKDVAISGFAANDKLNFQIRLSTGVDSVAVAFGACTRTGTTTSSNVQVGLRGVGSSDFAHRIIGSGETWATSIAGTLPAQFCTLSSTKAPANGLVYSWQAPAWDNTAGIHFGLPFTEDFNTIWADFNSTTDVPNNLVWRTYPGRGETSWRVDNTTNFNSGWTDVNWAAYTVATPANGGTARFHSGDAAIGLTGYMDLYLNFTDAGQKVLRMDYINAASVDGNADILDVQLSTDGGLTFVSKGTLGQANAWASQTINLGSSTSATCIIRFKATADYGGSDIGIDNIQVNIDNTVPLHLLAFSAQKLGNGQQLSWVTANEQSTKGFNVETATDGRNFNTIGFVASKAVNGFNNGQLSYNFLDSKAFSSSVYYRLKMIDLDGKNFYSPIVVIKNTNEQKSEVSVYPTLVEHSIMLHINNSAAGKITILVADITGRIVTTSNYNLSIGSHIMAMGCTNLHTGSYVVSAYIEGKLISTSRIIKN